MAALLDIGNDILRKLPRRVRYMVYRSLKDDPWTVQLQRENWIYIHIPKTAGSSISSILGMHGSWHSSIDEYMAFEPELTSAAFKFSIIRNPWDRMVSAFHYARTIKPDHPRFAWYREYIMRANNFKEFLSLLHNSPSLQKIILRNFLFRPQLHFISIQGQPFIDHQIRFERLPEELPLLLRMLGKRTGDIPHLNASRRVDYRTYFKSSADIELIEQLYESDVAHLQYSFE